MWVVIKKIIDLYVQSKDAIKMVFTHATQLIMENVVHGKHVAKIYVINIMAESLDVQVYQILRKIHHVKGNINKQEEKSV